MSASCTVIDPAGRVVLSWACKILGWLISADASHVRGRLPLARENLALTFAVVQAVILRGAGNNGLALPSLQAAKRTLNEVESAQVLILCAHICVAMGNW